VPSGSSRPRRSECTTTVWMSVSSLSVIRIPSSGRPNRRGEQYQSAEGNYPAVRLMVGGSRRPFVGFLGSGEA
jgi:hypothetical protein